MVQSAQFKNRILASLPEAELNRLREHLVPMDLPQRMTLMEGPADYGYFLESGLASAVVQLENGASVEVGVIGRDGIAGIPILLGTGNVPGCVFMQIAGSGFRIEADQLKREYAAPGEFRRLAQRYVQAFIIQASQTAACNAVHNLTERLARWLLTCHDRVDSDQLRLADDFLGRMLAAPLPKMCAAADLLSRAGFIDYSDGVITVRQREALENTSCDCYWAVRKEFQKLGLL
jgi:CRP-like cAMP-binding protein